VKAAIDEWFELSKRVFRQKGQVMLKSHIAKITQPDNRGTTKRERAFLLMDKACVRSVLWVSAPAGAGKTTLVSSYLESQNVSCFWYQMDKGDQDIATFFYYIKFTAQKLVDPAEASFHLPVLTPEYAHGLKMFTRRYFESLFALLIELAEQESAITPPHYHSHTFARQVSISTDPAGIHQESEPERLTGPPCLVLDN
ncbi:MAG: hypothetical protein ACQEUB_03605, partial [Thermodesulfobacteriota bacterium]